MDKNYKTTKSIGGRQGKMAEKYVSEPTSVAEWSMTMVTHINQQSYNHDTVASDSTLLTSVCDTRPTISWLYDC